MTRIFGGRPGGLRMCRRCGCDDDHACITDDGPCAWVLLDVETPTGVCSACAESVDLDDEEAA
jgi:hypothetical protein